MSSDCLLQGELRFQSLFKLSMVQPLFIGSTVMYWALLSLAIALWCGTIWFKHE
jgi:hypothetical protein